MSALQTPMACKAARHGDGQLVKEEEGQNILQQNSHASGTSQQTNKTPDCFRRSSEQFNIKIRLYDKPRAERNDASALERSLDGSGDLKRRTVPALPSNKGYDLDYVERKYLKHEVFSGYNHGFVETIDVVASSQKRPRETIAFCRARLIRQDRINAKFYQYINLPCEEATLLAFDLFDRYGKFSHDYQHHKIKRGSGFWKNQIDDGDILLIEDVQVQESSRRCGLGRKMVQALLAATHAKTAGGRFVAIVWPDSSKHSRSHEAPQAVVGNKGRAKVFAQEDANTIRWFRHLGFRRIGITVWFGLCGASTTPDQSLALADDYDPPKAPPNDHGWLPESLIQSLKGSIRGEFVTVIKQHFGNAAFDDPRWFATNEDGNTLLHIAARRNCLDAVTWILSQEFGSQMMQMRNWVGDTPLEVLLLALETRRTRMWWRNSIIVTADDFEGYKPKAVKCIAIGRPAARYR
ncbi:hypothetical protein A1O1_03356 [Capronia coronata CBS 617.96]|uniref:N-acetyltransferase domain-containing protein n=1 Tax=Capronia coronata CBS 617.96 TaxID=1182541 RepID=W9YBL7_9EURO|nr:uncharacterized protein A1O1_03356 [Capronia coronata CBS 617.96]EXJ90257.1 hypothetical protein A1O1_03356 [Capronia coronata CBS 617.96]